MRQITHFFLEGESPTLNLHLKLQKNCKFFQLAFQLAFTRTLKY